MRAEFEHQDGVADRVVVWCADCGGYVSQQRTLSLLVFDGSSVTVVPLPAVSMTAKLGWGSA